MDGSVAVLHPDQVWDVSGGCFFVRMDKDGSRRHRRQQVYKDATGRKFVVVERSKDAVRADNP